MEDVKAEIIHLTKLVENGLIAVHRRFDDDRRVGDDRHRENISRFQRQDDRLEVIEADIKNVEVQCVKTNGTLGKHESWLTRHDEQIRSLYRIAKDKVMRAIAPGVGFRKTDGDARSITQRDVTIALGSITAGVAAFKFIEWIVRLIQT